MGSGNFNKRRKLDTLARSFRCATAICSWVIWKSLAEPLIGAGLLHGVEVGALQVLDDGHLQRLLVGDLADDGRDGRFAGAGEASQRRSPVMSG